MSRPDDSTVTIRATGSGPAFLALLEAAARIDGAVVHCGRAEPRSVEAAREELDAAHAALAPRRAAAAAAMRERSPAVAAAIEALERVAPLGMVEDGTPIPPKHLGAGGWLWPAGPVWVVPVPPGSVPIESSTTWAGSLAENGGAQ